jgi:hypothetical protein
MIDVSVKTVDVGVVRGRSKAAGTAEEVGATGPSLA